MDPRTAKMLAEHERMAASAPPPPKGLARVVADAKAWVKTHRFAATLASAAAIVAVFLAYDGLVAKPARQREHVLLESLAVERLKVETATRQVALDACLSKAQAESNARWNATCKTKRQPAGCSLSRRLTDELQRREGEARNSCLLRLPLTAQ